MSSLAEQCEKIKYLHLYLAEDNIKPNSSLNVMFAVKNNNDDACVLPLRVYVCPSELADKNAWIIGEQKHFKLEAKKIQHIYMNIQAEAFSKACWSNTAYDEFLICCANCAPSLGLPQKKTTDLVFIAY